MNFSGNILRKKKWDKEDKINVMGLLLAFIHLIAYHSTIA